MFLNVMITGFLLICTAVKCVPKINSYSELHSCNLGPLRDEIASYDTVVRDIIDYVVTGPFKGKTYEELAKFVDKFGSRITGSETLEKSIDYLVELTRNENVKDVVTEELEHLNKFRIRGKPWGTFVQQWASFCYDDEINFNSISKPQYVSYTEETLFHLGVPHWMRGEEKVTMLEPRVKNIAVLGLGGSVSTPLDGITAEVIVLPDFTTLANISIDAVRGKIALFDHKFTNYAETAYSPMTADKASEKGAVAALVRSVTSFSINSPHTVMQTYLNNITKIPTAAISLEDSSLIRRLTDRGEKVVLKVVMSSTTDRKTSRNTLVDLKGTKNPEKLVIVSGHIDSWDVGQGAMDDGGGLFISWAAPVILKRLNLRPKRTIRSIFWTGEEQGFFGANAYNIEHKNERQNINFVMESDEGTFAPLGLRVAGTNTTRCIVAEVLKLFGSINATALVEDDSPGSDITVIMGNDIPGASLYNGDDKYFWFHHSEGDTMNVENPHELDLCAALYTATAYIIANISVDMPRIPFR